jgi:hypothetical protein
MSVRETYTLAHTAQCKLHLAVNRPDRNWRFIVGHAVVLDTLMLRIVEMEEETEKSAHASEVKFKGVGKSNYQPHKPSPLSGGQSKARRSPPPPKRDENSSEEEEEEEEEIYEDEAGEDLGLMRFPSGSTRPPQPPPDLIPSDDDSSSSDEDEEMAKMLENLDMDALRKVTKEKGNEELAGVFNSIQKCPCHKNHDEHDAPPIENFWELPNMEGQKDGVRMAVVEVTA